MDKSPIPVGKFADIAPVAGAPQRVHYHDVGEGPVVIFLHGAGGGASSYSNFKGNYPEFARAGYRCVVADMLGFGLSSKPDIPQYDLDFFVAGVKGLVDALGLKDITLVGNSLGGAVSLGARGQSWLRFHSLSLVLIAAVLLTIVIGAPLMLVCWTSSS